MNNENASCNSIYGRARKILCHITRGHQDTEAYKTLYLSVKLRTAPGVKI